MKYLHEHAFSVNKTGKLKPIENSQRNFIASDNMNVFGIVKAKELEFEMGAVEKKNNNGI